MINNAFITGAASGIGKATAEILYAQGWSLALADIDEAGLSQLTQEWDKGRVRCYPLDVRDFRALEAALQDFTEAHDKRLHALVNCAGILQVGKVDSISFERHQQIFDINVQGTLNACLAALPYLRHTSQAVVINLSSITALYGTPHFASYSASKFAIKGLTEALNLEWQNYDIRVCDILPPFINTPMFYHQGEGLPIMEKLGLELQAEDVAQVVLKQILKPKLHRMVGWRFQWAWALLLALPHRLLEKTVRKLNQ
ncbi:MAG: hypothetical protein RL217_80 [Pseudomonadota bacterium]|jgi:NAD(P)-dependent dehydrogenase (short-subunit alcohol dehydrogenase family)